MKLALDEFEHQIDETILERGFDYFRKGRVTDVSERGDGDYELTVEGTETYTVELSIRGNVVTGYECDCPYDWGPVCKHVAASLFYLQAKFSDTTGLPAGSGAMRLSTGSDILELSPQVPQDKQKAKPVTEQAKELLDTLPHDALKEFVYRTCLTDSNFCRLFLAKHIHLLYPESKELYKKQLLAFVRMYSDEYGFTDDEDIEQLECLVDEMMEEAMACVANGQIQKAMDMASAVIEVIVDLIDCDTADDEGWIDNSIENAFAVFYALAEADLSDKQHNELFDYLLTLYESGLIEERDCCFTSLASCIKLVRTGQEKNKIKSILERIKPSGKRWDWKYSKAQELMLALIEKTESPDAAVRFMENNLSNPLFRAELIENALKANDYAKVERLAGEGIAQDEKESPGLADDWRNYLLIAYRQTGDTQNTVRWARYFLIHASNPYHPSAYYYQLLKSLIPREQWNKYVNGLIYDIKTKRQPVDYDLISQLYVWEEQWDKLFGLLRQHASFERIANAEKYLAQSYSKELAELYKKLILIYLEQNMGRKIYQTACRYIRRMIKLEGRPVATDLVRELKALYPRRKALFEELDNV